MGLNFYDYHNINILGDCKYICITFIAAVIGGGIGGTSLSHFLKKSMPEASVHLYEKGEIGGRLKTIDIAGRNYECGGSIIHPKNLLMKKLVEEMGLSPTDGMHFLRFHF